MTERPPWTDLPRTAAGRLDDWLPRPPVRPALRRPRLAWLGPITIVATTAVAWVPMAGAPGRGNVAYGLFVGAAAITLMAWSFVLAVRLRWLERLFGGLDRMYRAHRWAAAAAVVAMFLHTRAEPDIKGGVKGASSSLADAAEDLAGTAETLIYVLVAVGLVRWVPYRWWRLTHKLTGVPFALACFHFYTVEKPYANGSGWGWWFGAVMVTGLVAYVVRAVGRDMLFRGIRYRVASTGVAGSTVELELEPVGRRTLRHRAGQFAMLKLDRRGMGEPHPFTVASAPGADRLRFFVRDLGDWSARLVSAAAAGELDGSEVVVEGPYGRFRPMPADRDAPPATGAPAVVWVAGGVGITPFLAAVDGLTAGVSGRARPVLAYCVRSAGDAAALDRLRLADAAGRITLHVFESSAGHRLDAANDLVVLAGSRGLAGAHVAVCGPHRLVADVVAVARRHGAAAVESEDFDIRSGVGPDLSRPLDGLGRDTIGKLRARRADPG